MVFGVNRPGKGKHHLPCQPFGAPGLAVYFFFKFFLIFVMFRIIHQHKEFSNRFSVMMEFIFNRCINPSFMGDRSMIDHCLRDTGRQTGGADLQFRVDAESRFIEIIDRAFIVYRDNSLGDPVDNKILRDLGHAKQIVTEYGDQHEHCAEEKSEHGYIIKFRHFEELKNLNNIKYGFDREGKNNDQNPFPRQAPFFFEKPPDEASDAYENVNNLQTKKRIVNNTISMKQLRENFALYKFIVGIIEPMAFQCDYGGINAQMHHHQDPCDPIRDPDFAKLQ